MEKLHEQNESLEGAKNWESLYSQVEAGDIKTSSGETYTVENLNEAIDVARATNFGNLNLFTRSEGLRSQAACLFIEEAGSFEELYNLLGHIDSITGSAGNTYSGEELKGQIESIENVISAQNDIWETVLQKVTRSYGLRDAVSRCLENRKN